MFWMVEVQRHRLALHLLLVLLHRRNNNKMEVHRILCLRDNIATIYVAENARVKIAMTKKMIPIVAPGHSALMPVRGVAGDSSPTLKMTMTRRGRELVTHQIQKLPVLFKIGNLSLNNFINSPLLPPSPPQLHKGNKKTSALVVSFHFFISFDFGCLGKGGWVLFVICNLLETKNIQFKILK